MSAARGNAPARKKGAENLIDMTLAPETCAMLNVPPAAIKR